MLNRPLILKLIAILLCLDPFMRIAFISIEKEFSISQVFFKVLELDFIDFFNFMFLFPISGLLLLRTTLVSYVSFFLIQAYSIYFHLNYESYSWPYLSESPSASAYFLLVLNIFMIIYFIFPRYREIFFTKELRWWEQDSRYEINEKCSFIVDDTEYTGRVCNFSFGGALVDIDNLDNLPVGSNVSLVFRVAKKELSLNSSIVRLVSINNNIQYGVKFNFENRLQKYRIKILMFAIGNYGYYGKYR